MPEARGSAPLAVGYLGPEGTFSEEALLGCVDDGSVRPVAIASIRETVRAVQEQAVDLALVPIENSVEGSVSVTLDTLTGEAPDVSIVGELILPVRHCLVGGEQATFDRIETVVSHPHVPGQCSRFLSRELPRARIVAATSTAEAVRLVAERGNERTAAIGTRLAARLYGCAILADGIQDREDNETRFAWLARNETASTSGDPAAASEPTHTQPTHTQPTRIPPSRIPPRHQADGPDSASARQPNGAPQKTSVVFWGAGAGRAGWLVLCLDEFAQRGINLTRIESRPMRERLGQYMFFLDLEGSLGDSAVASALDGLRELCEQVRVLGSYPRA